MRDLPLQIFKEIFRYLEQKDLQTCYFVCKSWYDMAIPLNWGQVTLQNSKIAPAKSYLHHLDHSQYFKYGHLITKLNITDKKKSSQEISYKFSKPELLALLNADLKHISEISTGGFTDDYYYDLLFLVSYRFRDTIARVDLVYDKNTIHLNSHHINTLYSLNEFKKLTKLSLHNKHDINLTPFQV
ncbi:hypothetical protein EDC94DRAFT_668597 [Helicostylum pulchrum]|nr:hypothetical protein EDC94DRAFT_668597 [Helicostylum pulchrum]